MDNILTITDISSKIKQAIEGNPDLTSIWIRGEISNLTYHSSGHIYLTLKDANSTLSAAFFKFANRKLKFKLKEGMSVFALGSVSIYEKRGSYQFIVADMQLEGIGQLQKQIDELKEKLFKEGLFDNDRKKDIPFLPKKVGVVTSPTGAAFRDILKVALRRFPSIEILLAPAKVQGDDAGKTIVAAIKELNRAEHNVDVIIAGRGGGSFEDLMPFNEEPVVRAFGASKIPIISAVGHQIDHPLSDHSADLYAPTPSAAAEMAIPVKEDLESTIESNMKTLSTGLRSMIEEYKLRVDSITKRRYFTNPEEIIYMRQIHMEDMINRMTYSLKDIISESRYKLSQVPEMDRIMSTIMDKKNSGFGSALQSLEQLSPLKVLQRGYSVTKKGENLVRSIKDIDKNDSVDIYLKDGKASCTIENIEKGGSDK